MFFFSFSLSHLMIYLGTAGIVFQSFWPRVAVKYTNKGTINSHFTADAILLVGYRDTLDDGGI